MNDTTKPAAVILDLDAMMDQTLDTVEDLPDFMNPPDGLYALMIDSAKIEKYTAKPNGDDKGGPRSRFRITHKVVGTIEVKEGEMPVPDGTLFSETFTGTEDGLKYFKKAAIGYMGVADIDGVTMGEVLASLTGTEYKARIQNSETPGQNGKVYTNVRIRPIHEAAEAE